MRINIKLACDSCKRENYFTSKNKDKLKNPLKLRKFCKYEKQRFLHTEKKK